MARKFDVAGAIFLNLKQLETFAAIVRFGGFAAAAARLNATQSTVSARIHELELELGVKLFDRSRRKGHPTAKGREMLAYAERAAALASEIRHVIGARQVLSGIVRMGVAELVAITWLPELVRTIQNEYPNITLELEMSLTADLMGKLRTGHLDLALVPGVHFETDLVRESLGSIEFAWMAGRNIGVPDRLLRPRDVIAWPVLSLGESSYHSITIERWLSATGNDRPRMVLCNSMSVIALLTRAGLGISVLPPTLYKNEIVAGELLRLKTDPSVSRVEFSAVYPRRQPQELPKLMASTAVRVSTFAVAGPPDLD